MNYIFIIVLIIGLIINLLLLKHIIKFFKYVLLDPRVNSILTAIIYTYILVYLVYSVIKAEHIILSRAFLLILWTLLVIADSIRDIIISKKFYVDTAISVDKFFAVKSIISLFTFGFSRIVCVLAVYNILFLSISKDLKKMLNEEGCIRPKPLYTSFRKNYYYIKLINKLERNGKIVTNDGVVKDEIIIRQKKLDAMYPKKLVTKFVDKAAELVGKNDTDFNREIAPLSRIRPS